MRIQIQHFFTIIIGTHRAPGVVNCFLIAEIKPLYFARRFITPICIKSDYFISTLCGYFTRTIIFQINLHF